MLDNEIPFKWNTGGGNVQTTFRAGHGKNKGLVTQLARIAFYKVNVTSEEVHALDFRENILF